MDNFDIDVVIIGINTEKTLASCIESVFKNKYEKGKISVFYSDGGSTDSSINIAKKYKNIKIIELNLKHPTPGIGRNAGLKAGNSSLVQFLDSDTILDKNWFNNAISEIQKKDVAAVSGVVEEINPNASIFNWIANLEWNPKAGKIEAFGGNVLIKRSFLKQTKGYDEKLVSGEDPELSQRIRLIGGKLLQIDAKMVKHDLAMTSIKSYAKRSFRTGYGYAAVTTRFLLKAKGFWLYELIRICVRGGGSFLFFLLGLIGSFFHLNFLLFLPLAFALLFYPSLFSISKFMKNKNINKKQAQIYSLHCSFIVLPEFFGICRYFFGIIFNLPLRNNRKKLQKNQVILLMLRL